MEMTAFLAEVAVGVLVGLAAILSLNRRLNRVLVEIFGTQERANFRARYANVMLILSPLLGVVLFAGSASPQIDFTLFRSAFKSALFGLFVALVVIGFQFVKFTRVSADSTKPVGKEQA